MWDEYRKEIEQLHLDDSVIKDIQQNLLKKHPHAFWKHKGKWAFASVFVACFCVGGFMLKKRLFFINRKHIKQYQRRKSKILI